MEVAALGNLVLNVATAALVAYTGRQLVKLRRDLAEAAKEVREELVENRLENGTE